ncbi:MAG: Integral membrane protein, DUF6 family [Parcubacteria group bacterium GW2011_GWC2_38_7]|nr:MAG: Integral membrane protein, DUF6 family [Parcubacteria group bacterium GW2011_GWC2_38_7]
MLWFWIVFASQFANAGAQILDKFLLTKKFPRVSVLTFWTAVWNLLGVVFVFWDFVLFPGWTLLILSLLSGVFFTLALQFFYSALKTGEASHMGPLVGGVVPIVSFIASYFWLHERLSGFQVFAIGLLVLGTLLISFEKSRKHNGWHLGMVWGIIAGIFFGLSYVLAHGVFLQTTFSTGFVWARIGGFLAALPLLLNVSVRGDIFVKTKAKKKKLESGLLILVINKTLAVIYFLGMSYALSLASATTVNALAGLQYAIMFVMIYIFSKTIPKFFNEQFTRREIAIQILALLIIIVGLALTVFSS